MTFRRWDTLLKACCKTSDFLSIKRHFFRVQIKTQPRKWNVRNSKINIPLNCTSWHTRYGYGKDISNGITNSIEFRIYRFHDQAFFFRPGLSKVRVAFYKFRRLPVFSSTMDITRTKMNLCNSNVKPVWTGAEKFRKVNGKESRVLGTFYIYAWYIFILGTIKVKKAIRCRWRARKVTKP